MMTEFGGICWLPMACLRNESTTTMRVNDVNITRIAGSSDRKLMTRNAAITGLLRSIVLGIETLFDLAETLNLVGNRRHGPRLEIFRVQHPEKLEIGVRDTDDENFPPDPDGRDAAARSEGLVGNEVDDARTSRRLFPVGPGRSRDQEDHERECGTRLEEEDGHLSCWSLSDGLMMSVSRMPNFSLMTTTSPRAISLPLTKTSIGSPTILSSSMTDPCPSWRRSLMNIFVRPISIMTTRGMSRKKLMSRPPVVPLSSLSSANAGCCTSCSIVSSIPFLPFSEDRGDLDRPVALPVSGYAPELRHTLDLHNEIAFRVDAKVNNVPHLEIHDVLSLIHI